MPTDPATLIVTLLIAALTGALGVIGGLLKRRDDDRQRGDDRSTARVDRTEDRTHGQAIDLATLVANVAMLMAERHKCDELSTRIARTEAWRDMVEPRVNEAYEGLRAVAVLGERMNSVFQILKRMEQRNFPAQHSMGS